ncbi:MAG: YkgJ family cysteine cluster protein [Bradymonadia bacterium]
MSALERYGQLRGQIDAFNTRVDRLQGPYLNCKRGCDGCCRTRRTAWAVEVEAIAQWLSTQPQALRESLRARLTDASVQAGERCVFLDADGACAVYPARPVICRTHGPAVQTAEEGLVWCGLNFEDMSPEQVVEALTSEAVLNLDHLNKMLVLINTMYLQEQPVGQQPEPRLSLEAALTGPSAAE